MPNSRQKNDLLLQDLLPVLIEDGYFVPDTPFALLRGVDSSYVAAFMTTSHVGQADLMTGEVTAIAVHDIERVVRDGSVVIHRTEPGRQPLTLRAEDYVQWQLSSFGMFVNSVNKPVPQY